MDGADRHFVAQALALGALGEGTTSPNPRVGCLVVRDGRVIGRGFHRGPGLPHAEALAVGEAGAAARGATVYLNLEPCAHHGRTPPCADLLVQAGVARVVASLEDPDPRVNGRGFARLRQAGIRVESGTLVDEAFALNEAFFHWHRHGRPLVTLKAALTLDGMLAATAGRSRWISGALARRFAHRLRLRHDAVLVGAATVRRDDPRLTVRLPGVEAPRLRAVLAPSLDLPASARLFAADSAAAPVRIYAARSAPAAAERALATRADVVRVGGSPDRLDLDEVLADLGRAGVQSVLVEGGGKTLGRFLEAGRADRAALFVAPRLVGARGGTPLVDAPAADDPARGWRLDASDVVKLGPDLLLLGRLLREGGERAPD